MSDMMGLCALQVGSVWPSERGGGGDRVFADLARHLPASGIGIEGLVAGPAPSDTPPSTRLASFGADTAGTRERWIGARRAIAARIASGGIDLIASHFALYGSAAAGRLGRLPHVVHFHGPWAAESRQEGAGRLSSLAKWSIERAVYGTAARVIVLSEAFAHVAVHDYGVPASRIRVIPGAVDLDSFAVPGTRADARHRLGWPADVPIVLSIRRLVYRTGIDRLLSALPAVLADVPELRVYIGGTGGMRADLEQQAHTLGLDKAVTFLGYVPERDLPLAYKAADLNVIPTIALEGFGLTAVEALAAGTPSLVTPIGGLPEIVSPLAPWLVLRSADAGDIARGLIDTLSGRLALPSPGECRAFAESHFSAPLMARRVAAVYEELCAS